MEIELFTGDDSRHIATVRIEPQSCRPPIVIWNGRYFVRCYDFRYRETTPVRAVPVLASA